MTIKIKDPWSALTHYIGMIAALVATTPLLVKATLSGNQTHFYAMTVFMLSMVLLYAASSTYHAFGIGVQLNCILKKLDHMMIPVLIAGTYTPICLITLKDSVGTWLCALVWGTAVFCILIKAFWINCPKWFSSVIYIVMGWLCILGMGNIIENLPLPAFLWLLTGGILYTIGGVIYALKLPIFNKKHQRFGSHEVFHLFVLAGSVCHYIVMYFYVC